MLIYNHKFGEVSYYDTPWNARILKGNALEIEKYSSLSGKGTDLLNSFCRNKMENGYELVSTRVPAVSIDIKRDYLSAGFYLVEHTLEGVCNGIKEDLLAPIIRRIPMEVEDFREDDLKGISDIASTEFKFGRFYEDPFIPDNLANERNRLWIRDLIDQGAIIKVVRKASVVVGFIAYKVKEEKVDMVLGGVKATHRFLSAGFYAQVINSYTEYGEVRTLFSSSNINLLNLLTHFGFRFENPRLGFHKHMLL